MKAACFTLVLALASCKRPTATPVPGEATVTLAGVLVGIRLPDGVRMREDDEAVTGEATTHDELAEGFAAFQPPPPRLGIPAHSPSWFLTAQPEDRMPASQAEAVEWVRKSDLPVTVLGSEALPGGGFLVTTRSPNRIAVQAWHPNGARALRCGGEDFRDPNHVAPPSWLDDPAQLAAARETLEAPCRTARVIPK